MLNLPLFNYTEEYKDECINNARNRIREYFDSHDDVYINFSFGKDSLLLSLLCYEVALEQNRVGKINLQTVELDEFVEHSGTVEWGTYVKKQMPIKWKLFKPTLITHPVILTIGLGQYPPRERYPSCPWKNIYKQRALVKKESLIGLRSDESRRRRWIINNTADKRHVPLYDVPEDAVWWYLSNNLCKIGLDYDKLHSYYKNKKRDGCVFCPYNKEGYDFEWQQELVDRYHLFRDMLIDDNILARAKDKKKFLVSPRIPFYFRQTYLVDEIRAIEKKYDVVIITEELQRILDELKQFYTIYGEIYNWSMVKNRYDEYLKYALYQDDFKKIFTVNSRGRRVIKWHNESFVLNEYNKTLY